MFYGLFIDGDIRYIIRWDHDGTPTIFDFNVIILSSSNYIIRRVSVSWITVNE